MGQLNELIVVCGLARCGTSLMMKMLHKGGIEPIRDPTSLHYGYEYNTVLGLPADTRWLEGTAGKAVKILDPHRFKLPDDRPYAFIFLTRDLAEQAKSHAKFLKASMGVHVDRGARKRVEGSSRRDMLVVEKLLASYSQSRVLRLSFERILTDPLGAGVELDDYLNRPDFDMLEAARCVIRRGPKCLPYMLETADAA